MSTRSLVRAGMPRPLARLFHRPPVVAVLRLSGAIAPSPRLRGALNLATLSGPLAHAFTAPNVVAVALAINSPGGAAAQSSLIFRRIRALAEETKRPVFAFAEDVAASGGYMLACAADEIYANESSIIGSIGVISAGFGFPDLLTRLGIERRVHAMGARKGMLDPFRPERAEDVAQLEAVQRHIYGAFTALVRERRGARLAADEELLFSGAFWSGIEAERLGLVDGIGDLRQVMRARFGPKTRLKVFGARRPWWRRRLVRVAEPEALPRAAAPWPEEMREMLETSALWARYGL